MLAVLCSSPRPPLGVGLLGLLIGTISSTLRLLPYIVFCSIIVLSIWVPSRPADPEVMYNSVDGHPRHVYMVYTPNNTHPTDEKRTFELNAYLRILIFLLSIPATSMLENLLFRPIRDLFLQTVECWYDMRYVQPVLATGSWPNTWTPILNALRSFQFVADFVDGVIGSDYSPSLPQERKARRASIHPSTPGCDVGACGGASSRTGPAVGKASSPRRTVHRKSQQKSDRKHASSLYPVIQSEAEDPSNISPPRKTFISPPRTSLSPPWNRGSRTSFPMSKDLSRMIGLFFRHPSPLKPIPHPRFSFETRALSEGAINVNFERLSHSTPLAPLSLLSISTCGPVISRPDFMKVPERVEQTQLTQYSDNTQLPLVSQRPEPQILMRPWLSVSASQEERPIQPQYTQFPAFHVAPYQEQRIPVYDPLLTVSGQSNVSGLSMYRPQPPWGDMDFEQQQLSEHMDIDLDCPPSLVHGPEPYASTTESAASARSPFHLLQDHFVDGSPPQLSNVVSGFLSGGCYFSYSPPVLQYTSAPVADLQEELSLPSPQCMPPREPFPAGPCAAKWTTYTPPATVTLVLQPHIIPPIQDVNAIETFSFNVHPDTTFSRQPAPAVPTCSGHTGDMSLDENYVSRPVSTAHAPTHHLNQNIRPLQTLPASSDHQPEVVSRPSYPVDSEKAKANDKLVDSSSSDSDTSDADYIESSEEDDSDSDDSSGGDEEAAIAGPSKIDKGKGKAP